MTTSIAALLRDFRSGALPGSIYCMPRARSGPRVEAGPDDPRVESLRVLSDAATAIQADATAEKRSLTEHESQAIDALFAQFNRIETGLDVPAPDLRRSAGRQTDPDDFDDRDLPNNGRRPVSRSSAAPHTAPASTYGPADGSFPSRAISPGEARDFRAMFRDATIDSGGFRSAHEMWQVLHTGVHDPRLISAATAHREGSGADGGYLVPTQHLADLLDGALESEVVRPRATVVPMQSNSGFWPFFSYEDRSSGVAGFAASWTAEGATMTPQTGTISQINLRTSKLAILTKGTSELVMDAGNFERQLYPALTGATGFELDAAFLAGTGVAQPKGVLNDDALVTVAKESGQAADTILHANLVQMFARLHPAGLSRSIWVINATALPQLLTLSIPIGDGGSHLPILRESGDGFTMLTRPVIVSEKLPVVGDAGDIILADFSQYLVGLREFATIARSAEKYFDTDEIGYRITLRADGRGGWTGPATPRNGSTLSWIVALAARA